MSVWARNLKDPKQKGATALLFLNANTTVCDAAVDKSCGGALPLAPGAVAVGRSQLVAILDGKR